MLVKTMSSKIRIVLGCRIEGSYGEFNPNRKKHRIKAKVMGTVTSVVGSYEWNVLFDYNGKVKKVISK